MSTDDHLPQFKLCLVPNLNDPENNHVAANLVIKYVRSSQRWASAGSH